MNVRGRAARAALGMGAAMMMGTGYAGAIPKVGTKAPDLVLPTVAGRRLRLSAMLGRRPVLVNFFATW